MENKYKNLWSENVDNATKIIAEALLIGAKSGKVQQTDRALRLIGVSTECSCSGYLKYLEQWRNNAEQQLALAEDVIYYIGEADIDFLRKNASHKVYNWCIQFTHGRPETINTDNLSKAEIKNLLIRQIEQYSEIGKEWIEMLRNGGDEKHASEYCKTVIGRQIRRRRMDESENNQMTAKQYIKQRDANRSVQIYKDENDYDEVDKYDSRIRQNLLGWLDEQAFRREARLVEKSGKSMAVLQYDDFYAKELKLTAAQAKAFTERVKYWWDDTKCHKDIDGVYARNHPAPEEDEKLKKIDNAAVYKDVLRLGAYQYGIKTAIFDEKYYVWTGTSYAVLFGDPLKDLLPNIFNNSLNDEIGNMENRISNLVKMKPQYATQLQRAARLLGVEMDKENETESFAPPAAITSTGIESFAPPAAITENYISFDEAKKTYDIDKAKAIFSTDRGFDTRKALNRSERVIPDHVIDEIEKSGVSSDMLDTLGVPVFKYKTQITLHGKFNPGMQTRLGGYKMMVVNQNGSLGVRYQAIDVRNKQALKYGVHIAKGRDNSIKWLPNFDYNAKNLEFEWSITVKNAEDYQTQLAQLKSVLASMPNNYIGTANIYAYKSFGAVAIVLQVVIFAIHDRDMDSLMKYFTNGVFRNRGEYEEARQKIIDEKNNGENRLKSYREKIEAKNQQRREISRPKSQILVDKFAELITLPRLTKLPDSKDFIILTLYSMPHVSENVKWRMPGTDKNQFSNLHYDNFYKLDLPQATLRRITNVWRTKNGTPWRENHTALSLIPNEYYHEKKNEIYNSDYVRDITEDVIHHANRSLDSVGTDTAPEKWIQSLDQRMQDGNNGVYYFLVKDFDTRSSRPTQTATSAPAVGAKSSGNVKLNKFGNRDTIELWFDDKPSDSTLSSIKAKGFRWYKGYWGAFYTEAIYNWAMENFGSTGMADVIINDMNYGLNDLLNDKANYDDDDVNIDVLAGLGKLDTTKQRIEKLARGGKFAPQLARAARLLGVKMPTAKKANPPIDKPCTTCEVKPTAPIEPQKPIYTPREYSGKDIIYGKRCKIITPNGNLDGQYAVAEIDFLIPSNNPFTFAPNPNYPAECQTRSYNEDQAERDKVTKYTDEFNYAHLINNSPDATTGTPICNTDGAVLGGNGRTMVMYRIIEQNKKAYAEYVRELHDTAGFFGLPEDIVDSFDAPVLIRVVDVQLRECSTVSNMLNKSNSNEYDAIREGIAFARQIEENKQAMDIIVGLLENSEADTFSEMMNDKTIAKSIINLLRNMKIINTTNQGSLIESDNQFTSKGKDFMEAVLLAMILPDKKLINGASSYTLKLIKAMPSLIRMKHFPAEWNLIPVIRKIIEFEIKRRAIGTPFRDYIVQQSAFTEMPSEIEAETWKLLEVLGQNQFKSFVAYYSDRYLAMKDDMFGEKILPLEVIKLYQQKYAQELKNKGLADELAGLFWSINDEAENAISNTGIAELVTENVYLSNNLAENAVSEQNSDVQAATSNNLMPTSVANNFDDKATLTLADMKNFVTKEIRFTNPINEKLLGQIGVPFQMLLWGKAGGGKSTYAVNLGNELTNHGKVLYHTSEEKLQSGRFINRMKLMGAENNKIHFSDGGLNDLTEAINSDKFSFVIIDSVNRIGLSEAELSDFLREFKDVSFILIAHADKTGKVYKGNSSMAHDVDTEVNITDGIATAIKHRDGETGKQVNIFPSKNKYNFRGALPLPLNYR